MSTPTPSDPMLGLRVRVPAREANKWSPARPECEGYWEGDFTVRLDDGSAVSVERGLVTVLDMDAYRARVGACAVWTPIVGEVAP